jgi:hypothetical protein
MKSIFLFIFLTSALPFFAQNKDSVRAAIGNDLKDSMSVKEIESAPHFSLHHLNSIEEVPARILELTLVLIQQETDTVTFPLTEKIINGPNRTKNKIIIAPSLEKTHMDQISKMKKGDRVILKNVKVTGRLFGTAVLKETIIHITE